MTRFGRKPQPEMRRDHVFWSKVDKSAGPGACWPWLGKPNASGYGMFHFRGRSVFAHREAWRLARGQEIEVGMFVCHKCDNPPCCNPRHLFLGTAKDNAQDSVKKGRSWGLRYGLMPKVSPGPRPKPLGACSYCFESGKPGRAVVCGAEVACPVCSAPEWPELVARYGAECA